MGIVIAVGILIVEWRVGWTGVGMDAASRLIDRVRHRWYRVAERRTGVTAHNLEWNSTRVRAVLERCPMVASVAITSRTGRWQRCPTAPVVACRGELLVPMRSWEPPPFASGLIDADG